MWQGGSAVRTTCGILILQLVQCILALAFAQVLYKASGCVPASVLAVSWVVAGGAFISFATWSFLGRSAACINVMPFREVEREVELAVDSNCCWGCIWVQWCVFIQIVAMVIMYCNTVVLSATPQCWTPAIIAVAVVFWAGSVFSLAVTVCFARARDREALERELRAEREFSDGDGDSGEIAGP